jgi:hypothetical protein
VLIASSRLSTAGFFALEDTLRILCGDNSADESDCCRSDPVPYPKTTLGFLRLTASKHYSNFPAAA